MLKVKYEAIKKLKPYKKNAKKHSKKQVEQISESIKQFGFCSPVLVDNNNYVVAGHGRVLGAKMAGMKEVPTICLDDLTEEQVRAYRLVDNKLNESPWDYTLLEEELDALSCDLDLECLGFEMKEEFSKYDIERHSTEDYKYNHILVTFKKDDNSFLDFVKMLNEKGYEYVQSRN